MVDMNALERQVAGEVNRAIGPVRPVDDLAVYNAVYAATQSPTWRFQSMFSATRFLVAGAIVALFGGFLLAGMLTLPSDDRPPVVGASASATTPAEPTDTATSEPAPTAGIEADDATTTDLLPGVDLVSEEVSPGVFHVLSDGEHDLRHNVWGVAVSQDGDVWVEKHRIVGYRGPTDPGDLGDPMYRNNRVLRLGEPGTSFQSEGYLYVDADDGKPHISGAGIQDRWFDGARWKRASGAAPRACKAVEPDGACWWWSGAMGGQPTVTRAAPDGTEQGFTRDDLGLGPDQWFGNHIAVDEDGTVWTAVDGESSGGRYIFAGLASYDGEQWRLIEYDEPMAAPSQLAVAPDGTVWVTLRDWERAELTVKSWDGETWATYGPVGMEGVDAGAYDGTIDFRPDGIVLFDPVTFFDGTALRRFKIPASASDGSPLIVDSSRAPDGSIWMVVVDMTPKELGCTRNPSVCRGETDGLYVITPEAMAASR